MSISRNKAIKSSIMEVKNRAEYEKILEEKQEETFWQSNPLDYGGRPYIELMCIPPFGMDYLLFQMTWNNAEMYWHRTTWKRENDKEILAIWLEYACNEDKFLPLNLTLRKEEGKAETKIIQHIIKQINYLSIPPILGQDPWRVGRDGESITLKIGYAEVSMCLTWQTSNTPDEWASLDKLAQDILLISNKLR
jgi:hypothetical protein